MRKWFREPWSPPTEEYYAAINKDEGADTYSPQRECEKLCVQWDLVYVTHQGRKTLKMYFKKYEGLPRDLFSVQLISPVLPVKRKLN